MSSLTFPTLNGPDLDFDPNFFLKNEFITLIDTEFKSNEYT